jgi:hypothetical protein
MLPALGFLVPVGRCLDDHVMPMVSRILASPHLCQDFQARTAGANPSAYFMYLRNESASSSYDFGCTPSVLASNFTKASLLVNERHSDFEKALDADAQKLLKRYDEVDQKKKEVLERRLLALSERGKKLDEIQAVLDRVTNWKFDEIDAIFDRMTNLGNSPSSKDLPKAKRILLREACFINNRRYAPGEIVTLPDGVRGPHRTVHRASNHIAWTINRSTAAIRNLAEICDVALYDVLPEESNGQNAAAVKRDDPS